MCKRAFCSLRDQPSIAQKVAGPEQSGGSACTSCQSTPLSLSLLSLLLLLLLLFTVRLEQLQEKSIKENNSLGESTRPPPRALGRPSFSPPFVSPLVTKILFLILH